MNVKATSILLAMLFVILLPEGSAFTAGAKVPLQGKREQIPPSYDGNVVDELCWIVRSYCSSKRKMT
ncbi:hypothetical protein ABFA07_006652 [Porites harrisoni]